MELLKHVNDILRIKNVNEVINNRPVFFYSIDYIENASDDMKIIGNAVIARNRITNRQELYVYNGNNFVVLSNIN